jgi:DNA-binding beta-propeller fold protein YncE
VGAAIAVWLIASPAGALAAVGDLTFNSCVADAGAGGCADPALDALNGPSDVAISPDGAFVYMTAGTENSVNTFRRTPGGTLTFLGCVAQNGASGCDNPAKDALIGAGDISISPNGADVYVTALASDAINHFDRDAVTGALTFEDCFANAGAGGCSSPLVNTMASPRDVAVSADGENVYMLADGASNRSVTNFSRNLTTGNLTYVDCASHLGTSPAGCAAVNSQSFFKPTKLVISPDDKNLYVTTNIQNGGGIAVFARAASGTVSFASCNSTFLAGCNNNGLGTVANPFGIAISPNGANVYVANSFSDQVSRYTRNATTGALSFASCVSNGGSGGCVSPAHQALDSVYGTTVSPDGKSLYVTASGNRAITNFSLAPDGAMTFTSCIGDFGASGCADTPLDVLDGPGPVIVSPNGTNVYVASIFSDAVVGFNREPATTPPPSGGGGVVDTTAPETTIDKGPKKKSRKTKASFSFSSSEPGSTFECKLDKKAFAPCSSPTKLKKLKRRKHKFQVRAIDAAGNADASPAQRKFKVLKKR